MTGVQTCALPILSDAQLVEIERLVRNIDDVEAVINQLTVGRP